MFSQMQRLRAYCTLMFQLSTLTLKLGSRQNLVILLTSIRPKSYFIIDPSSAFKLLLGLYVKPEALMLIIPKLQAETYFNSICVIASTQQSSRYPRVYSSNTGSVTLDNGKMDVAPQQIRASRNTPPSFRVGERVLGMEEQSPVRLRYCSKSVYQQTGPTRQAGRKLTQPRQFMYLGFQMILRFICERERVSKGFAPF